MKTARYALSVVFVVMCDCAFSQSPATNRPGKPAYNPPSSEPDNLFVLKTRLFFSADDGVHGTELWMARDLISPPQQVKDITPGPDGTILSNFSSVGDLLIFRVERNGVGEPWVSDGTADGTKQLTIETHDKVPDYFAPGLDIGPLRILVFRTMYTDGDFWITDGTPSGTHPLGRIGVRPYIIRFTGFTLGRLGNRVLFRAAENGITAGLFVTDGTDEGTQEVTRVWDGPGEIIGLSDKAVFHGASQREGAELWVTQGTEETTKLLVDLMPGEQGSSPGQFAAFKGRAYFAAQTPEYGRELWTTDGTPDGTHLVKDIFPGASSGDPGKLTVADEGIYFIAQTEGTGRELWYTDGTPEGTHLERDIYPGPGDSDPYAFCVFNNLLYFSANNPLTGEELYLTGPGADNARLLADLNPETASAEPALTVRFGEYAVFAARHPIFGRELFKSSTHANGGGIDLVADINSDGGRNPSSTPQELTATPNALLFVADDIEHGAELWATDGTPENTRLVRDIFPGPASSDPQELTLLGKEVFFRADDGTHGVELWGSDGTQAGTRLVSDIAIKASSAPREFTPLGDSLFFVAFTPELGTEVWVMKGIAAHEVKDIFPGPGSSDPTGLVAWRDRVYFRAHDLSGGDELWCTNGTVTGTYMVRDIVSVPLSVSRAPVVVPFRDSLFLANDDGSHGSELWRLPELGGRGFLVKDIARTFASR